MGQDRERLDTMALTTRKARSRTNPELLPESENAGAAEESFYLIIFCTIKVACYHVNITFLVEL